MQYTNALYIKNKRKYTYLHNVLFGIHEIKQISKKFGVSRRNRKVKAFCSSMFHCLSSRYTKHHCLLHMLSILGHPKAFPDQMGYYIIPPACSGSAPGPPCSGECLEHIHREVSKRPPNLTLNHLS